MKISEIMTKDVEKVTADCSIEKAAGFMLSADTGAIPVTDGDKLVGMITDRDIAVRGVAKGCGPDTKVSDLMTREIVSANVDDDVQAVAEKMNSNQVRRLPVVDGSDSLCGMVSLGDLSRETDGSSAEFALKGVSRESGQHNQGN